MRQACVTIASYALSHPAKRFDIQVLIHDIDAVGLQLLKTTAAAFGLKLGIIQIDLEWTKKLPEAFRAGMMHVSPMTYSKLIAMEYIPASYTKCLMVDSDLLIVGGIDSLLSLELGEVVSFFRFKKYQSIKSCKRDGSSTANCLARVRSFKRISFSHPMARKTQSPFCQIDNLLFV